MSKRFARGVARLPLVVVVGWLALAPAAWTQLPSLDEASQSGVLGDLVPAGAEAIDTERRIAELFALPLSSRTMIVERDPRGLSQKRVAVTVKRIADINRGRSGLDEVAGAYGVSNGIPRLPFARERSTTNVTFLLFPLETRQSTRERVAHDYAKSLGAPSASYVGVTGAVSARRAQADVIAERLPLVELVTVAFIALTVALYARSLVAPLVTLLTVAVAYVMAVRLLAAAGTVVDISIPSEVEPVAVALIFGVVTDYALFYTSRFRRRLAEGMAPREAAERTAADLTPIVLACGLSVAAGCGALAVANLGFLRAFGPGLALAVLVALAVALTLLPALLALLGERVFWPSRPRRGARQLAGRSRTVRVIGFAVRRPRRTLFGCVVVLGAMASGLAMLDVGNPLIRGLPASNETRESYAQISKGFAPGVTAPVTVVVEAPGIVRDRERLERLQRLLSRQPGVAGVVGPATSPSRRVLGAVLSRTGDAARFVLIPSTDPLGAAAVKRLDRLERRMDALLGRAGLDRAKASFAGDTALVRDVLTVIDEDIAIVTPAVLLAVGIVIAVFLRSLIAPLYLVALAAVAPAGALGVAAYFFEGVLGFDGLSYFVPIVSTVLLVALGSDYNVFLAGRVWADARERPLEEAIVSGGSGAAHAIAAAGIVLAASFAALALVPVRVFGEIAFTLAAGLLIDAFVVRAVLAPAVISLVGKRSAWPGRFQARAVTRRRAEIGG